MSGESGKSHKTNETKQETDGIVGEAIQAGGIKLTKEIHKICEKTRQEGLDTLNHSNNSEEKRPHGMQ